MLRRLTALAVLALTLPACSGPDDAGKPHVAVVTNNEANFWNLCEAGARKAEKEFGVKVTFRRPSGGQVSTQEQIIDDLVGIGVRGLAVSVINPKDQTPKLKNVASKLHLITMDTDAPEAGRIAYVGTENYAAGRAAGKLVKEAIPGGGTVAVFVGMDTQQNSKDRFRGVLDELGIGDKNAEGKYTLFEGQLYTDGASPDKANEVASNVVGRLAGTEDVCLVGLWAYNPPALLSAVRAQKQQANMKIVGFDEYPETLNGIADGGIVGTVVQDPFQFGYTSVKLLAQVAKGEKEPGDIKIGPIPHRVITGDGRDVGGEKSVPVADFKATLAELQ